ncbi:hypothetical protein VCR5J5_1360122 [Vibrio crassostreae]|uniref:Uncharacterized protein n=1 Tax=Vibrio crassostreae TaxID=246167 RepID=A0A822MST0_9VIBR|nr:hypothetical protein VCR5J5_1360122 [Vibrio crassostreae]
MLMFVILKMIFVQKLLPANDHAVAYNHTRILCLKYCNTYFAHSHPV